MMSCLFAVRSSIARHAPGTDSAIVHAGVESRAAETAYHRAGRQGQL